MKIILKQDVKNLGHKDDVVAVKNGYANNFLFPRGMAVLATESNLKVLAENQRQASFKQEKIKNDALVTAEKLKGASFRIGAKAGASGKIFGAVTPLQLAEAIQKSTNIEVDRRKIVFDEEPKQLGNYVATLNLHREVSVQVNVEVAGE